MIRITCYIKPHRLETVKSAIAACGVTGMSVSDVRGTGNSDEQSDYLGGQGIVSLPIRAKLEVVAPDDLQEEILTAIETSARTGEHGDGKIFVERVADALRIRTSERGDEAI